MANIIITTVYDAETQETTANIAATGSAEIALHDVVIALAATLQQVAGQVRAVSVREDVREAECE